jgi:transcription termination factor NusB
MRSSSSSSSRRTSRLVCLLLLAMAGCCMITTTSVVAASGEPSDPRFDSAQEAAAAARDRMDHAAEAAAAAAAAGEEDGEAMAETVEAVFDDETAGEAVQRTVEEVQGKAEQVYEAVKETITAPMTQEERRQEGRSLKDIAKNGIDKANQSIRRLADCVTTKAKDIQTSIKTSISNMERKDVKKVAAAAVGAWGIAVGVGYLTTPRGGQQ